MTLGPMRAQGTTRTKLTGVLAAIALIGLSAVGLQLSEPEKFQVISGMPGETVKINNGEVSVTQIRVGTFIEEYDQIGDRTPGMFVAVHVTGAATGPKELKLTEARLLSKDVRYERYKIAGGLNISPGFQTSFDTVFEVDPAQIDDLTIEMWANEVISGYQQRVQIKLGVTAANAEQWRAAARTTGIEVATGDQAGHSMRPLPMQRVLFPIAAFAAVAIYLIWWVTYAGIHYNARYSIRPPGAAAEVEGSSVRLLSLVRSDRLADASGGMPVFPDPGAVWVVGEFESVRHDPAEKFLCGTRLLGPQRRVWIPEPFPEVKRVTEDCQTNNPVGQAVRFESIFMVPARYADQLIGIELYDPSTAARTPVLTPPL